MGNTIRLAGIAYESLVNGPGMRRVFFSQGCKHNCKGCFNPDTHSFDGGEEKDMDELIKDVLSNPMIKGVTFSGGDPFERPGEFAYMGEVFKKHGLNIWSYTGYTYEFIVSHFNEKPEWRRLINTLDVLVDGEFQQDKKEEGLLFKGSSNQRIIDVKESLKRNQVVIWES